MNWPRLQVGKLYTREEVAQLVGLPADLQKGNWLTGYMRWQDAVFIFTTVGGRARTGHDYGNRWDGKELIWYGRTGSRASQPLMTSLLSGQATPLLFWRTADRGPFTFAGAPFARSYRDTSPIEVTWSFEGIAAGSSAAGSVDPASSNDRVFRRGPRPSTGEVSSTRTDGPTAVYLMRLSEAGALVDLPSGYVVVKVGLSNDVSRRLAELNVGFPPGSRPTWRLIDTRAFETGLAAFDREGKLLEWLRRGGHWIGGEYATIHEGELERLADRLWA